MTNNLPPVVTGKLNPLFLPRDHPDNPITKTLSSLEDVRQNLLKRDTDDGDHDALIVEKMIRDLQEIYPD